jgi:hypothetical protein
VATRKTLIARISLGFLVAFLSALPTGYAFFQWTVQPGFCINCHLMVPYHRSWVNSEHGRKNVTCVQCHYEPGVLKTIEGKITALNMVMKYVTGTEGTKPWAQVSDASCNRPGCHSPEELASAGTRKFELGRVSVNFDHGPHLKTMVDGNRLRCTSCHNQVVDGEHISLTVQTCYTCHFKRVERLPQLGDCDSCHGAPATPIGIAGDAVFDHAPYAARGVDCESCHAGTTRGAGEVSPSRCIPCHGAEKDLSRYGDTALMHKKHVSENKVDCLLCHNEITHRLRRRPGDPPRKPPAAREGASPASPAALAALVADAVPPDGPVAPASHAGGSGNCAACHASTHGPQEAFIRGQGGSGEAGPPSAMWLARVDCAGCHLPSATPGAKSSVEAASVACHGASVEGMLARWQESYGAATEAVGNAVAAALAKAGEGQRTALEESAKDIALVRADGSRGVHNPGYARILLEKAHRRAAEASGGSAPPFPLDPPFATKLTCATLCHTGIEKQGARKDGTRFAHRTHVGKVDDCNSCHSTGSPGKAGEPHGRILPQAQDCASCHHGPKPVAAGRACVTCHEAEDRFVRGIRADGSTGESMMKEVACEACHGEPPGRPVLEAAKPLCIACHDDKANYGDMAVQWSKDGKAWLAEADARLTKVTKPSEALDRARAHLRRLRMAVPAHNIILFEEEKGVFDEAASAAEKAK